MQDEGPNSRIGLTRRGRKKWLQCGGLELWALCVELRVVCDVKMLKFPLATTKRSLN